MEIPVPSNDLAGPDLFFRIIKGRVSVSVGEPEKFLRKRRRALKS